MLLPFPKIWQKRWNELALVFEEIAGLVEAHVPLAEGLRALADDAPNARLHEVFEDLSEDVSNGFLLHEAMQRQENFFPPYCVHAVRAGEDSGRLAEVLHDLQENLSEMLSIRARTEDVGVYVFGVLLVEAVLILGLLTFVAPQAVEVFESFSTSPPFMMRVLIFAQTWYVPHLLLAMTIAVPLLWALTHASVMRGRGLARTFNELALRIPILRARLIERHLANASAIASLLLEAGLPLHTAFRAAAAAPTCTACERAFARMSDRLEQGAALREALRTEGSALPPSFRDLLRLGEASGQMPEALQQLKDFYQRRAARNARILVDVGGPVFLCLTGGLVFIVYYAFFQWILRLPFLIQPGS